jgi:hypothetical protein
MILNFIKYLILLMNKFNNHHLKFKETDILGIYAASFPFSEKISHGSSALGYYDVLILDNWGKKIYSENDLLILPFDMNARIDYKTNKFFAK